jgi:hypothetical protein
MTGWLLVEAAAESNKSSAVIMEEVHLLSHLPQHPRLQPIPAQGTKAQRGNGMTERGTK